MLKAKHIPIIVFITLGIILTVILNGKYKSNIDNTMEKYKDDTDRVREFLLKYYDLSLTDAEKLLPRIKQGEYRSYFDIKQRDKPTLMTNVNGKKYIVPPLTGQLMRDPRDKIQKLTRNITPIKVKSKEAYMPNIPTPELPRPNITFDQDAFTRTRLQRNRVRDSITSPTLRTVYIVDDEEPDVWSEGARGILIDSTNKKLYMCNKGTINKFNVSNNLSFNISMIENPVSTFTPQCQYEDAYGYGQPTQIKLEFGRLSNLNRFIVAPVICNNRVGKLQFFSSATNRLSLIKTLQLPNGVRPKWIAHDKITNFTLIPSSDNLTSIGLYSIYPTSGTDITIRKIMDLQIVGNDRQPITIEDVTAGCFSDDGTLYLLSNSETNNGFVKVYWTNDNKLLVKDGYTNFTDDELVGITVSNKDILVLVRNNDWGDDNISIIRIIEQLPEQFSWNNPVEVLLHKNMNFILSDVLMQEACGSCWAFASTSMLADRYGILNSVSKAQNLSATRLISCSDFEYHCDGGSTNTARNDLIEYGTVTESCWDYKWCSSSNICSLNSYTAQFETDFTDDLVESIAPSCINYKNKCISCDNSTGRKICSDVIDPTTNRPMIPKIYKGLAQSHVWFNSIEDIKNDIFLNGPVTTSIIIYKDFLYNFDNFRQTSGVYIHSSRNYYRMEDHDEQLGRHVMTIVGWGIYRNRPDPRSGYGNFDMPYWIVKNSWGIAWGDFGYCKIAMSDNERGINDTLTIDVPATYGLGWLGISVGGASSILPDPSCPCASL
jgi:hypothetical protein